MENSLCHWNLFCSALIPMPKKEHSTIKAILVLLLSKAQLFVSKYHLKILLVRGEKHSHLLIHFINALYETKEITTWAISAALQGLKYQEIGVGNSSQYSNSGNLMWDAGGLTIILTTRLITSSQSACLKCIIQ